MLSLQFSRQRVARHPVANDDGTHSVPLSNGTFAIVDDAGLLVVAGHNWCATGRKGCGATKGQIVDHANGDTLDNRLSNLRLCDLSKNAANSRSVGSLTGYRGVSFDAKRQKYRAHICIERQQFTIGRFDDPITAARAYDDKASAAFGEFAQLNFPGARNAR